jgi:MarR family transcriptional regulator, organic hydroperoxide resistance regulator
MSKQLHNLYDEIIRATRLLVAESVISNSWMAEKLEINVTDLQVMNILDLFGEVTPRALSEKTGLSTPGVTLVIDRLEKAGYAKRFPNPKDRRSVIIRSLIKTPHQAYQKVEKAERDLLAAYSQKELETILHFLTNISPLEQSD